MKSAILTFTGIFVMVTLCFGQWSDQNSNISNDLNAVFFLDNNTGWAVGRQGKVLHTTDGGNNWSLQNSGTTEDLNKVHMISTNVGYAVGDNGTLIKYDGASWSTVNINYSQDMHGVYFLDANTGWISGDWGRIMKTTNGGSSWTTEMDNSTYTNLFYDLHMISASEGWAVGTSGKVLKYDGASWSAESTPAGDDLFAVDFSSGSNGFMVGDQSKVYHYDGTNWTQHSTSLSSTSYDIEDVDVIDANTAFAATAVSGGGGIILRYDGASWSTEYENTDFLKTELFYGIHFPSASKGYTVGAGGMIKTKGSGTSSVQETASTPVTVTFQPNPVTTSAVLEYVPDHSGRTTVTVSDMTGRVVEKIVQNARNGIVNTVAIDLRKEEAGLYTVQVSASRYSQTLKVIKRAE